MYTFGMLDMGTPNNVHFETAYKTYLLLRCWHAETSNKQIAILGTSISASFVWPYLSIVKRNDRLHEHIMSPWRDRSRKKIKIHTMAKKYLIQYN
jgi:hypothetical protein